MIHGVYMNDIYGLTMVFGLYGYTINDPKDLSKSPNSPSSAPEHSCGVQILPSETARSAARRSDEPRAVSTAIRVQAVAENASVEVGTYTQQNPVKAQ